MMETERTNIESEAIEMMNEDVLKKIEYLRDRTNVSYEEAANLLEQNQGDMIRCLMILEQQGRLNNHSEPVQSEPQPTQEDKWEKEAREAGDKAKSFFQKAMKTRLVVEKKKDDGTDGTIVNLNVPIAAGAVIVAPYLAVAAAAAAVITGCKVKLENDDK